MVTITHLFHADSYDFFTYIPYGYFTITYTRVFLFDYCPGAIDATLKNMVKFSWHRTTTTINKHKQYACFLDVPKFIYRKTSNIRRTITDNNIVDHWDACQRCFNYIFILDLTSGFKRFGKDSRKTVR